MQKLFAKIWLYFVLFITIVFIGCLTTAAPKEMAILGELAAFAGLTFWSVMQLDN